MVAYCSVYDVHNVLSPDGSTPTGATAVSLNDGQIEKQIEEASSVVQSHLLRQYAIEVDADGHAVSNQVRTWTANIAAYLSTLVFMRGHSLEERHPVALRYRQTIEMLEKASSGELQLDLPDSTTQNAFADIAVHNTYEGRMFDVEDFGLKTYPRRFGDGRVWY